jgi:predicted PurR-regulated permease PerM
MDDITAFIEDLSGGVVNIRPTEIQAQLMNALGGFAQNLIQMSSSLAGNLGSFFVGLVMMLFCLFFFYLDASYLASLVFHAIPIRREYMLELAGKFKAITKNLFLGYILVALVQSVIGYILFRIFSVQSALVFASLILICSFIPIFGAGLVWFPLGLLRILSGDMWGGLLFLAVCGPCISLTDNILRPLFLQDRINLHPLVIFVAILGGVQAFGFNGLVLGPMIVILFLTVLDLFLAEHNIASDEFTHTKLNS